MRECAAPVPRAIPADASKHNRAARSGYTIPELSRHHFTTFVDQAFRAILKRPPDAPGFEAHLRSLIAGTSKIEILGDLRYSPEGRLAGVKIRNLLPRYVLSKLYRIPVLGYLLEWLVCVAGLPFIARHQRAADTLHSARIHEVDAGRRTNDAAIEILRGDLGVLEGRYAELVRSMELTAAEMREELTAKMLQYDGQSSELRHLVLSMNHWMVSLRQNLAALEAAEFERSRTAAKFAATLTSRLLEADAAHPLRLTAWAGLLSASLPQGARILDVGNISRWRSMLVDQGFVVHGLDAREVFGETQVDSGTTRSSAELAQAMSRMQGETADALVVPSMGSVLGSVPMVAFLDMAMRILKPDGLLLVAFERDVSMIAAQLGGENRVNPSPDVLEHALRVAGYADVVHSKEGACLLARRPGMSGQSAAGSKSDESIQAPRSSE